jgi:hypothetical protein
MTGVCRFEVKPNNRASSFAESPFHFLSPVDWIATRPALPAEDVLMSKLLPEPPVQGHRSIPGDEWSGWEAFWRSTGMIYV